jgi:hypothetical protein
VHIAAPAVPWRKGIYCAPLVELARSARDFFFCSLAGGSYFPASMVKGQKVVCINDTFSPTIRALYKQLPVKDNIYTVREVFLGREKIVKGGDTATVGLLLEELKNPPDPFHQGEQELGFSSERFAPLNEVPDEEAEVEEVVGVGAWAPV